MKPKLDSEIDPIELWKLWNDSAPSVWDGYTVGDDELPRGVNLEAAANYSPLVTCECGAHITYGDDCIASLHSDYCGLFKKDM